MTTVLETERLLLRPWTLEDFDDFAAMYDPQVMRFLADDGERLTRFGAWRAMAGISRTLDAPRVRSLCRRRA